MARKKKGDVTYTLRADDSNLDNDLSAAEKKVEKYTKETAQKTEHLEKKTAEVQKEVKEDVTDYHKQQNKEQENSDEDSYKKREDAAKSHGENLKSIAGGTAKAIGAGMLAVGTAVVGTGVLAVNSANNLDQAMNQFVASTGKGSEETERYETVLKSIYKNNYGESFEDIGQAMAEVTKQLGDMDDTSLQEITESAFALRDVFEYDISESTRAAKALMINFGISGEKAMSLIAAGAQNGLDYSGELIDSINEYSVQFAKVGLSADDMFKIIQKGAETGAWNVDKIGDAIKELSIKAIDGSDVTAKGFETIGLNADEMAKKFAAGGESAREAFQQTVDALAGMEDPLAQNLAGVNLFGTMWEDLGPEVVTQLASIEDGAYDAANAIDTIKAAKYNDLSSIFEGLTRSIEILLVPLGQELIPLLADLIDGALPVVEDILPQFVDLIAGFADELGPSVKEMLPEFLDLLKSIGEPLLELSGKLLPAVKDLFSSISPYLGDLVENLAPTLMSLLDMLLPKLLEIVDALLPPLFELLNAILPILDLLIGLLAPIIDLFSQLVQPIVTLISEALTPLMEALEPIVEFIVNLLIPALTVLSSAFQSVFEGIVSNISNYIQRITDILNNVVEFIKNVFTGNWEGAWENIKNIFGNIMGGLVDLIKAPINLCIDKLNGFINGINSIKAPDWIPIIGGKSPSIPNIPKLRVGMDYVPSDDFPALLHKGEAVLTAQENAIYQSAGGFEGLMQSLSSPQEKGETSITVRSDGGGMEIDYERLGKEFSKSLVGMIISMDGKTVGKLVASAVDEELGRINGRRT